MSWRIAFPRLAFAALGFVPITALAVALFGWLPLDVGLRWLVLPAAAAALALGLACPRWGKLALKGFACGLLATAAYDVTRLALVAVGVWPDFIPPIGKLALADPQAHPAWGYVWRFLGNGGGMGVTFMMLPWRGARSGMIYGAFICLCLYVTLILGPGAQDKLFPLTAVTAAAAMIGHLDYGAVLGYLARRWRPVALSPARGPSPRGPLL